MISTSTTVFFSLICGVALVFYIYIKHVFTYWSRHGIWQFSTLPPFGNALPLIWNRKQIGEYFLDYYKQLKAKKRSIGGLYLLTKPVLLITDPELVQNVLVTDFSHFRDRGIWYNEEIDPLSANLFSLPADRWKTIKNMLLPFFTMNKMKLLFPTIEASGKDLIEMTSEFADKSEPVNMKNLIWRFNCIILGSCFFGFNSNTAKDPNDIVFQVGKDIIEPEPLEALKRPFFFLMPHVLKALRLSSNSKLVTDFFFKLTNETIEYRQKNNIRRDDLIQLLIDARKKNIDGLDDTEGLTTNEIASQCWLLFAGGFETAVVTFFLYELSQNMEIQDKVRKEVMQGLKAHDGEFTFEGMSKMKYLEAALRETLRKYPPLPFLNRECTKEYTFPNTDITLRPGDAVVISPFGLQRDEDIYPDPEKFDPDRFLEENGGVIAHTFLPFGDGPRSCIGYRLGLLQGKYTVAVLLKHFKFTLNNKTKIPFELERKSFTLAVDGGIWFDIERI